MNEAKKIFVVKSQRPGSWQVRVHPVSPAEYHVGQSLPGGFVVDAIISEGGSGIVLKAHKPTINPPIFKAIKVINPRALSPTVGRAQIQREFYGEARVSSEIGSDPYAVAVEDIVEMPDGTRALIFPFVQGHTLRQLHKEHLARGQLLPFELTAFIFHRILSVLVHAREKNVAHRDLCGNNVMVQRTGVPMLLDWGAGTDVNDDLIIGKPGYMAPELLKAPETVTPEGYFSTDIFSLGALMRELLIGTNDLDYRDPEDPCYDVEQAFRFRESQDTGALPSPAEVCRDIPTELSNIVCACMRETPRDRPEAELLYDYLGAKYLYTAQVGFGFTAESLKDYLHYFFGRHADDEGLTDDKIGRNMAKIISSKLRKKAESPEYQRVSLKAIAKAEGIRFVCGNIWRTLTEAFGAERIDEAARDVLTGRATEAPRGGQTRGEPSAAAPMGAAGPTGQLAERLGAETGKTGTALQFELSRRITRRVSERSRAGRLK